MTSPDLKPASAFSNANDLIRTGLLSTLVLLIISWFEFFTFKLLILFWVGMLFIKYETSFPFGMFFLFDWTLPLSTLYSPKCSFRAIFLD